MGRRRGRGHNRIGSEHRVCYHLKLLNACGTDDGRELAQRSGGEEEIVEALGILVLDHVLHVGRQLQTGGTCGGMQPSAHFLEQIDGSCARPTHTAQRHTYGRTFNDMSINGGVMYEQWTRAPTHS